MIINQKLGYNYTPFIGYKSELIKKYRYINQDRNKILIKSCDTEINNIDYRTTYNSINLGDRSIIIKKICLSNINNSIKRNHPISLSLTDKEVIDDNNLGIIENQRTKLYNFRIKKLNMIIKIQSCIRRFLVIKKYFNELQNIKIYLSWSKRFVYRKKIPSFKNINLNYATKIEKSNISHNNFFTKNIIVNTFYDKKSISKIQKFWRNKKYNLIIGNYSRISNYQCQSEIINKFNFIKKINLTKRPKFESLFNSVKFLKEESNNSKDKNKKDLENENEKDKLLSIKEKDIFNKLYLENKFIKRPQYIKLCNRNNKTAIKQHCIDIGLNDDIYHYEINDINRSFKDKSITLFHDKNKNGNYIQQIKSNTEKKFPKIMEDNQRNSSNINNNAIKIKNINLKIWQKSKINCKYYMNNLLKYKNLKPNKNLIIINSSKFEKNLILERKKDIINKPNKISILKKVKNNSKKDIINQNVISKYFINDNEKKEPKLSLERKLIMIKPNIIRK